MLLDKEQTEEPIGNDWGKGSENSISWGNIYKDTHTGEFKI